MDYEQLTAYAAGVAGFIKFAYDYFIKKKKRTRNLNEKTLAEVVAARVKMKASRAILFALHNGGAHKKLSLAYVSAAPGFSDGIELSDQYQNIPLHQLTEIINPLATTDSVLLRVPNLTEGHLKSLLTLSGVNSLIVTRVECAGDLIGYFLVEYNGEEFDDLTDAALYMGTKDNTAANRASDLAANIGIGFKNEVLHTYRNG